MSGVTYTEIACLVAAWSVIIIGIYVYEKINQ